MNLSNPGFYKSNIRVLGILYNPQNNKITECYSYEVCVLFIYKIMINKKGKATSLNKRECSFHNVISFSYYFPFWWESKGRRFLVYLYWTVTWWDLHLKQNTHLSDCLRYILKLYLQYFIKKVNHALDKNAQTVKKDRD